MLIRRNDSNWDMTWGSGLGDYYRDNNDCIGQNIKSRLLLVLGEYWLDTSDGTPWQLIIGVKPVDTALVEQRLRARVLATEGVVQVTQFRLGFNSITRKAAVLIVVLTIYGTTVAVTLGGTVTGAFTSLIA